MPTVKTNPVLEAMTRKLLGINNVPPGEQAAMIKRAAKAGAIILQEQYKSQYASLLQEAGAYLRELAAEREWMRNSTDHNNRDMARLDALIEQIELVTSSKAGGT